MPDQVENTGSDAQSQPEATPAANGADSTGRKPRNGFETRIAELVQQKHEINRQWQTKYDDLLGEIDAIKKQLSDNKSGSRETPQGKSPIFSGFGQMSDEDVDTVLAQGPQDNPAFYASVLKESQRRYGEQLLSQANKQQSEQQKKHLQQQKAWNEIKSRFGPDLDNPQSELRVTAERYMAQLRREEGEQVVNDMNAQYRCVAAAHHDLHARDSEELQTQRREVERLKQTQAMGTGVKSAMRLNDKVEEELKKARLTTNASEQRQAIGKALRNLEMVRDVRQDV
jgi:hypothetical protein